MSDTAIPIALVQMRAGTRPAANLEHLATALAQAAADGARYIQTPEMSNIIQQGRSALDQAIAPGDEAAFCDLAAGLAARHGIVIHLGSLAVRRDDGGLANRAFVFDQSGLRASYDKIHMFDVDLDNGESWRESATYDAGDTAVVVHGTPASLGLAICYDLRFPDLFRTEALAGGQGPLGQPVPIAVPMPERRAWRALEPGQLTGKNRL